MVLSGCLRLAHQRVEAGQRDAKAVLAHMRAFLATEPDVRVEYVVLADPDSLAEVERIDGPTVALIAAFVGATRLIDNQMLAENSRRAPFPRRQCIARATAHETNPVFHSAGNRRLSALRLGHAAGRVGRGQPDRHCHPVASPWAECRDVGVYSAVGPRGPGDCLRLAGHFRTARAAGSRLRSHVAVGSDRIDRSRVRASVVVSIRN